MDFNTAFERVIGHEGGFQRDPRDRGNWTSGVVGQGELKGTKFGISAAQYPLLDIKNLSLGLARTIYERDYWAKLSLDKLPESIRFDLFDTAVNSGVSNAGRILQDALKVEPRTGFVGPKTIAACQLMNAETLDKRFNGARLMFLAGVPSWPSYGAGWVRRVAANLLED